MTNSAPGLNTEELNQLCCEQPADVLPTLFDRLEPPTVPGLDAEVFFENLRQNLDFVAENDVRIRICGNIHKLKKMAEEGNPDAAEAFATICQNIHYFSSPEWREMDKAAQVAKEDINSYFRRCAKQAEMLDAFSEGLDLAEFFTAVKAAMLGNEALGIPNYTRYRDLALQAFARQSVILAHELIDSFEPNKMLPKDEQVLLRAASHAFARQYTAALETYFCQVEHAVDALAAGQSLDQALSTALARTSGVNVEKLLEDLKRPEKAGANPVSGRNFG